jgi:hypothetical protein
MDDGRWTMAGGLWLAKSWWFDDKVTETMSSNE